MNSVCLIGNLGADPVIRSTGGGKKVANLRVAYNEGSGDKKQTHWFNVVAWDKDADFAESYLRKGSRVGVSGRLTTRSWMPKDGSGERRDVEITANRLDGLDSKDARVAAAPELEPRAVAYAPSRPVAGPLDYRVKENGTGKLVAAGEVPPLDDDLPF